MNVPLKDIISKGRVVSHFSPPLQGFQRLVKEWPSQLYNIQTLVNAVLDKLDRDYNNAILLQCLGDL